MAFEILPFSTSNIPLLTVFMFVAGLVEDILDTWVTFAVVKRQTITTALITFFGIILEFTVFLSFFSNLDKWYVILSYAAGATVGTTVVVEYQKRVTRRKKARQKQLRLKGAKRKREVLHREARRKAEKIKKVEVKKVEVKTIEIVKKVEPKLVATKVKKNEPIQSPTKINPPDSPVQPSS